MFQTYQCSLRSQAIREREEQEEAYERLEAMLRVPKGKAARHRLAKMFAELNDNLGLGLKLGSAKTEKKKKRKEEEDGEDMCAL